MGIEISKRLIFRDKRARLKIKQKELEARFGFRPGLLSQLENGETTKGIPVDLSDQTWELLIEKLAEIEQKRGEVKAT
jgi:transcriptional regulator with XRE-family HTH domain